MQSETKLYVCNIFRVYYTCLVPMSTVIKSMQWKKFMMHQPIIMISLIMFTPRTAIN